MYQEQKTDEKELEIIKLSRPEDDAIKVYKILASAPCADEKYALYLKRYQNERE